MTRHSDIEATTGKASLHVLLAAIGLLAIIGLFGWSAYVNNFSDDGLACRDRGGRMAWAGCVGEPKNFSVRR